MIVCQGGYNLSVTYYNLETLPRTWVGIVFVAFALLALRGLWRLHFGRRVDSTSFADTRAAPLVVTTLSLAAAAVMADYMYVRFQKVEVHPDRLELTYYWPRAKKVIKRGDFQRAELISTYGQKSRIQLYAGNRATKSIPVKKTIVGNLAVPALNAWRIPPN